MKTFLSFLDEKATCKEYSCIVSSVAFMLMYCNKCFKGAPESPVFIQVFYFPLNKKFTGKKICLVHNQRQNTHNRLMTIRKTKPAAFSCLDWLPFPPLRASQQVSALMKIDIKIKKCKKIMTKMENIKVWRKKKKIKGKQWQWERKKKRNNN